MSHEVGKPNSELFVLIAAALLTVALAFVPGLGLLAIVPAMLVLAYVGWLVLVFANRVTPDAALRRGRRRSPGLLGPGGPDDPDQTSA